MPGRTRVPAVLAPGRNTRLCPAPRVNSNPPRPSAARRTPLCQCTAICLGNAASSSPMFSSDSSTRPPSARVLHSSRGEAVRPAITASSVACRQFSMSPATGRRYQMIPRSGPGREAVHWRTSPAMSAGDDRTSTILVGMMRGSGPSACTANLPSGAMKTR